MAWVPVNPSDPLEPGIRYRVTFQINAPFSAEIATSIFRALKLGQGIASWMLEKLASIRIADVFVAPPEDVAAGRNPYFAVIVVYELKAPKLAAETATAPAIVINPITIAGALAAILLLIVGSSIVSRTYEKELIDPTRNLIKDAIPLLGLVLLILIARGK